MLWITFQYVPVIIGLLLKSKNICLIFYCFCIGVPGSRRHNRLQEGKKTMQNDLKLLHHKLWPICLSQIRECFKTTMFSRMWMFKKTDPASQNKIRIRSTAKNSDTCWVCKFALEEKNNVVSSLLEVWTTVLLPTEVLYPTGSFKIFFNLL